MRLTNIFMIVLLISSISFNYQPTTFYDNFLPDQMYIQCEQQGNVEEVPYDSINVYTNEINQKKMLVWTPYDYNKEEKYNVLILMHGGRGSPQNWISTRWNVSNRQFRLCDIYDNIVAEGKVKPFIVVSIPAYFGEDQMASDLRYGVLPVVINRYSTWGEGAREHFGIGGPSNGSFLTFKVGMAQCFDLFGNFVALSGNGYHELANEAINKEEWKDLPITCFFAGCGNWDGLSYQSKEGYDFLKISNPDRLFEYRNCWYKSVTGGHDWKVWSTEIYNALQVLFRE